MATTIGSLDLASLKNLRDDLTQYFWFESSASATYGAGVHVTLVPDTTFMSNPTGQNILMNTDGLSIRNGLLPMMTLDNDSLDFNVINTTAGTYTTTATFTATGAQIGQSSGAHSVIDANGQRFYASNGTTQLANIGYGKGVDVVDGTTSVAPYYSMGVRADENDDFIHDYVRTYSTSKTYNVGDLVLYNSSVYICQIEINTPEPWTQSHWSVPIGNYSISEGMYTISAGYASHAEGGDGTTAIGLYSHAEGEKTIAIGDCSHAEGMNCIAQDECSHAEGSSCIAQNKSSHAEGDSTIAKGECSHAQNFETIASGFAQTALGLYNIEDNTPITNPSNPYINRQYAFIIGNGTDEDHRSNAFTVGWDGYVYTAKDVNTTTVANIISVNDTNATITSANYVRRGNVAQIQIVWTNKSAISVPASGNIANVQVGTLVSGKQPLIPTGAWSVGDNAGAAWYNINSSGTINLGACEGTGSARTIAAGSTFWCCATFLVD